MFFTVPSTKTDGRTIESAHLKGTAVDVVFAEVMWEGKLALNPLGCWYNAAQAAETLPERQHRGKVLLYRHEEWLRVQRTKSIFLFYFYM